MQLPSTCILLFRNAMWVKYRLVGGCKGYLTMHLLNACEYSLMRDACQRSAVVRFCQSERVLCHVGHHKANRETVL